MGSPAVPLVKVISAGSSASSSDRGSVRGRVEERLVGHREHRARRFRGLELGAVSLVGDDERGIRHLQAQREIVRAQLLGAREHDGAKAKARHHREHPLGPVADERHHDVATADAARRERRGEPRGALAHLPEGPVPARAVTRQLHDRALRGGGRVEHVAREVAHRPEASLTGSSGCRGSSPRSARGRRRLRFRPARCDRRAPPTPAFASPRAAAPRRPPARRRAGPLRAR